MRSSSDWQTCWSKCLKIALMLQPFVADPSVLWSDGKMTTTLFRAVKSPFTVIMFMVSDIASKYWLSRKSMRLSDSASENHLGPSVFCVALKESTLRFIGRNALTAVMTSNQLITSVWRKWYAMQRSQSELTKAIQNLLLSEKCLEETLEETPLPDGV